jgi:hypothetical protein
VTTTGATITWTTDQPADSQVEYGSTTAYGSLSPLDTGLVTSHTVALSGLGAGTQYHYRVHSRNASGIASVSADATFATTGTPPPPAFRSASTVTDGATVARPSGVAAGDLLLASLEVDADPATVTGPAGWTLLQDVRTGASTSNPFHAQLWYKVAGSAEPASYTWSVGGSPWTDIGVLDYTNVSSTAPIDVSAGRDAGSTTTPATGTLTTTSANDLVVAVFVDYATATWTPGPGTTKRFDFDGNTAEDKPAPSPGAVGPATATSTAAGPTAALIVALRGS